MAEISGHKFPYAHAVHSGMQVSSCLGVMCGQTIFGGWWSIIKFNQNFQMKDCSVWKQSFCTHKAENYHSKTQNHVKTSRF